MKNKKLFAIIGVCLIVVAAVIGIFAVKNHRDKAQAEVTESEAQVVTEGVQLQETEAAETEIETEPQVTFPAVTATQEQLDKVVYSAQIGEVNGTTYSVINVGTVMGEYGYLDTAAETPVIPRLPVEVERGISSFAEYDGYVYYTTYVDYERYGKYGLYRCKNDFTENELLLSQDVGYSPSVDSDVMITDSFVIDDGKLYAIAYEFNENKHQCVDLATKEITFEEHADYRGLNGIKPNEDVVIYGGKVFVVNYDYCKHDDKVIGYQVVDGKRFALKDEKMSDEAGAVVISGCVGDYIYYFESFNTPVDGANNLLKKYSLCDGTVELVDKRVTGGRADFFHPY